MRVTLITDKPYSAIDRLARLQIQFAPWHEYRLISVHPKRPTEESLNAYTEALEWCDFVDFRYWKSAMLLNGMFGNPKKPAILTHYNPYDVNKENWTWARSVIVVNSEQQSDINAYALLIPLTIDVEKFAYSPNSRHAEKTAIIVANRIEAKKGILPAIQACEAAGFSVMLVGNISDKNYFDECVKHPCVTFHENVSDEQLRLMYQKAQVHICNSVDKFETGTLPVLEAMASGTIVIARRVGHVPDLNNGNNMLIHTGEQNDVAGLKAKLDEVANMEAPQRNMLSEAAWKTARTRHASYAALRYSKLYHMTMSEKPLVSVIIPTADRPESLAKTLVSFAAQDYGHYEIIVADDGLDTESTARVVAGARLGSRLTIKYVTVTEYNQESGRKVYNLAAARNEAAIYAEGKYLMFVDDRLEVDSKAISLMVQATGETTWVFGVKNGVKKGFVENFSLVSRETFFKLGGFNERINSYGGMTQDVATRCKLNQIRLVPVEEAEAKAHTKSSSRWSRKLDIVKTKVRLFMMYGENGR